MPTRSAHRRPAPSALRRAISFPRRTRRRLTGMLAVTVTGALVAGGVLVATADAQPRTPKGTHQAESFAAQSGAQVQQTSDTGGGQNVGWLTSGDWLRYSKINLGRTGSLRTQIRVASANQLGGTLELRADSLTGPVLASYPISGTGGWQKWVTQSATTATKLTGRHDVLVTLHSGQPSDFVNLNWFLVRSAAAAPAPVTSATTTAAPVPPASVPGVTPTNTAMPPMTMPSSTPISSSTPSMTMPAGTTMPPMAPPAPGTWISVDPVKQAADTRAFFARTPKTVTNNPVKVAEFNAGCAVSHHASDDPIVFPGRAGASHNHTFIGNTTTDASSTLASLKAGATTCSPKDDLSAYWVPTLYQNGKVVDPKGITVYYGSRLKDPSRTQPFPAGFRMITGDAKNQVDTPDKQGNHFWCAGIGGEIGRTADGVFPICAPTAELNRQITFPDCWDGVHLDSPDHKGHVSNAVNGACPAAFPVAIPNVSFVMAYPLSADTSGITLASGTSYSMHADFFNAWDDDALAVRVRNCLDQGVKCNSAGNF